MEDRMRSLKILTLVASGVTLLSAAVASAKGPAGSGTATHTPGVPQGVSQGDRAGAWTNPPGWNQGEKKSWNGASVPPGFDNGDRTGWGTSTLPPGIQKKQ
jgi:transcription elongation factor